MQISQTAALSASPQVSFNPSPVKIVEPIRRMRGGCQSHFMRGEDEAYYVVKAPQNPQGKRTLVNELLYSLVALDLQLPVAQPRIVSVSQALIDYSAELYFETPKAGNTRWRASLCYGSKFPVNPHAITCLDFLPDVVLQFLENPSAFAGALVLDQWFANADPRQAVFFRKTPYLPYQAVLIDHGLCFHGNRWAFDAKPVASLFCNRSVYATIRSLEDFEPWLSQIESVTIETLRSLVPAIPPEWFCHDFERLDWLLNQLVIRKAGLRSGLTLLCANTPSAFPNWRPHQGVRPTVMPAAVNRNGSPEAPRSDSCGLTESLGNLV